MINQPTTKIVLVKMVKQSGKYPVKLRVTYNGKQKFYPCNIDLSINEFDKILHSPKPRQAEKTKKDILLGIEVKALGVIHDLKSFDFKSFESRFYRQKSGQGDVYDMFHRVSDQLMNSGQVGTGIMYNTVMKSLQSYRPDLSFEDITPSFLSAYENWMVSNSKSITTVGIYLRHLRGIYNRAISENIATRESYPFGRTKYITPVGNNIKKALTREEVGKIFNYETQESGWERKAKDFWIFSYLCNGMNIMDIAKLKYKDIYNGEIHYQRSKTIRTNRGKNSNLISIPILPQTEHIIATWGNSDKSAENFIFPIISAGLSPLQIKMKVQQFTKNMNNYTKRIAISLGIDKNVTTYVARHSYATVLKRSGTPIEAISENMGHRNVSTTKSYLDSFESDARLKDAQALVAFETNI